MLKINNFLNYFCKRRMQHRLSKTEKEVISFLLLLSKLHSAETIHHRSAEEGHSVLLSQSEFNF